MQVIKYLSIIFNFEIINERFPKALRATQPMCSFGGKLTVLRKLENEISTYLRKTKVPMIV